MVNTNVIDFVFWCSVAYLKTKDAAKRDHMLYVVRTENSRHKKQKIEQRKVK